MTRRKRLPAVAQLASIASRRYEVSPRRATLARLAQRYARGKQAATVGRRMAARWGKLATPRLVST